MTTPDPGEVPLLQALVAGEHAAVYGYGLLGARLSGALRGAAGDADDRHRLRRDALTAQLQARSAPVPAAQGAYDVAVADEAGALALAVRLEEGVAVLWRDLVAGTDDRGLRRLAVAGLTECAVRAARWREAQGRPPTVALPGQP